jgi:hypothetical protein
LEIAEPKGFALSPLQSFRWSFRFQVEGSPQRIDAWGGQVAERRPWDVLNLKTEVRAE